MVVVIIIITICNDFLPASWRSCNVKPEDVHMLRYSYPTNFLQYNKYFYYIVIQCLIFDVFYIATFDISFITMFIYLYFNNQPLHVTTHRVFYTSISSPNVIMCLPQHIPQLVIFN